MFRTLQDVLEYIVGMREYDVPYHVRFAIDTGALCTARATRVVCSVQCVCVCVCVCARSVCDRRGAVCPSADLAGPCAPPCRACCAQTCAPGTGTPCVCRTA
jgi:hypothetical protein